MSSLLNVVIHLGIKIKTSAFVICNSNKIDRITGFIEVLEFGLTVSYLEFQTFIVKTLRCTDSFYYGGLCEIVFRSIITSKNFNLTRMHSSRMHTACSSSRPGGVSTRHPPDQAPPQDQATTPGSRPPRSRHTPQDQAPLGADTPPPRSRPLLLEQAPPREQNDRQV